MEKKNVSLDETKKKFLEEIKHNELASKKA